MQCRDSVIQAVLVIPRSFSVDPPVEDETFPPKQHTSPRRRKKRWKYPGLIPLVIAAAALVTIIQAHVTSEGTSGGEKNLHLKFLRSEHESDAGFASLDDDDAVDDLSRSTQERLSQDEIDVTGVSSGDGASNDIARVTHFNGSRSSRLLRALQSSFERHFKDTLLCDSHDIIFSSGSGSIVLETITLEGCKNMTSLSNVFELTSLHSEGLFNSIDIEKYRDDLRNLTVTLTPSLTELTAKGFRSLRRLNLRHNGISAIKLEAALPNLVDIDLSGNPVTHFNADDVTSASQSLKKLVLSNCSKLQSIDFAAKNSPGLLVNLDTLILDDNPELLTICPWFLRSAPNLSFVSLNRCPKLDLLPGIFIDQRFFPKLEKVFWEGTSGRCDCNLARKNATTHDNVNLKQIFLEELKRQKVCRHNSSKLISVESFIEDPEMCQEEEFSLSENNPTLSLTWFDPYAEEDSNSSLWLIEPAEYFVEDEKEDVLENGVHVWTTVQLDCQADEEADAIFWVTPSNTVFLIKNKTSDGESCQPTAQILENACGQVSTFDNGASNVQIFDNGTLVIKDFGWADRGFYECFVSNGNNKVGYAKMNLTLDHVYRNGIYNLSLIWGFAFAGAFLLLTLLFKLVHFLLHNYGCCLFCCCCENKLPPKARRLKRALDSIEAYRTQQLDKLRDNYTQQSDWIRENCASQMDRVRENYNSQIQNLKDIRQYGSSQLSAVRGQYYEQMSRIRDYSANQLDRVHENYIFQRQRLRKFSAQNYLRVQETGVYTRKTLSKVMENIPVLYLDLTTCKQGLGDRQPSIEWIEPDQFLELEQYSGPIQRSMLHREQSEHRSESIYFTPTGTPVREVYGSWAGGVQQQSNSLKNTPTKEVDPYKAVYVGSGSGSRKMVPPGHRRNRSFSQFLPPLPTWLTSSSSAHFLPGSGGRPVREMKINEVEVVIEHETNSNDYYLDADVSTTTTTTCSKSAPSETLSKSAALSGSSMRRSVSVPSDEASGGKMSLTSSSGVLSLESNNSPQQTQVHDNDNNFEEVPLLQRRAETSSVLYLFPEEDSQLKQKRLSL